MEWSEIEKIYQKTKIPNRVLDLLQLTDGIPKKTTLPPKAVSYYEKAWIKANKTVANKTKELYKVKASFYALKKYYNEAHLDNIWERIVKIYW